jgi:hypothetical protein
MRLGIITHRVLAIPPIPPFPRATTLLQRIIPLLSVFVTRANLLLKIPSCAAVLMGANENEMREIERQVEVIPERYLETVFLRL